MTRRLLTVVALAAACGACDLGNPDDDAPKFILGPIFTVSDTSLTVAFGTNEPANALVEYGPDEGYGTNVLDELYVHDHSVLIRNLTPETEYHVRLSTYDALDNGPTRTPNQIVTTLPVQPPPPVVVNEVLANADNEFSGEFVELFNSGTETESVAGWTVADNAATDDLIPFAALGGDTTDIPAGGFAVILDPDYGSNGEDYLFPAETILLTVDSSAIGDGSGLSNASDAVTLRAPDGKIVSTYGSPGDSTDGLPFDPGNGISVERCDPAQPDELANWRPSTDGAGHTAGRLNSGCP